MSTIGQRSKEERHVDFDQPMTIKSGALPVIFALQTDPPAIRLADDQGTTSRNIPISPH